MKLIFNNLYFLFSAKKKKNTENKKKAAIKERNAIVLTKLSKAFEMPVLRDSDQQCDSNNHEKDKSNSQSTTCLKNARVQLENIDPIMISQSRLTNKVIFYS